MTGPEHSKLREDPAGQQILGGGQLGIVSEQAFAHAQVHADSRARRSYRTGRRRVWTRGHGGMLPGRKLSGGAS